MIINKKSLSLILSSVAFAGSAFAIDLESTEKAPIQTILPNAYGKAELNHYYRNDANSSKASAEALYTLGSKFFNGSLDANVVFGVKKDAQQSHLTQKSTDVELEYTAYENDYAKILPYATWKTPYVDGDNVSHNTEGRFGFSLPVTYDLSTQQGIVTFGAEYDVAGTFNSRPQTVAVTQEGKPVASIPGATALTTNDNGELETSSQALGLRQAVSATVAYTPNFVDGLYMEYKLGHKAVGTPVMELNDDNTVVAKSGDFGPEYNHSGATAHRLRISYDINETLFVNNDFEIANKVAKDENGKEQYEYQNLLTVGANLF